MNGRPKYKHVKQRALERLGIFLTDEELDTVTETIEACEAHFIEALNGDRGAFLLPIQGHPAVWIYCTQSRTPVTVVSAGQYGKLNRKRGRSAYKKRGKEIARTKRWIKGRKQSGNWVE